MENQKKSQFPIALYYYVSVIVLSWLFGLAIIAILGILLAIMAISVASTSPDTASAAIPAMFLYILLPTIIITQLVSMFLACKISAQRIIKQYKDINKNEVLKLSLILFVVLYIVYIIFQKFTAEEFQLISVIITFIIKGALFYFFSKKFLFKDYQYKKPTPPTESPKS